MQIIGESPRSLPPVSQHAGEKGTTLVRLYALSPPSGGCVAIAEVTDSGNRSYDAFVDLECVMAMHADENREVAECLHPTFGPAPGLLDIPLLSLNLWHIRLRFLAYQEQIDQGTKIVFLSRKLP